MAKHPIPALTAIRKQRELSLSTVAAGVGCTEAHIWRIEQGQCGASPELADRIAKFFGNGIAREQILYPAETTMQVAS